MNIRQKLKKALRRLWPAIALCLLVLALAAPAALAVPEGVVSLGAEAASTPFTVKARDQSVADEVLSFAGDAWQRLAPRFSPLPPLSLTIVVVQDQSEYEAIQPAPMTRGFATFGGSTMFLRGDQVDEEVVAHELTHILLGKIVRQGLRIPDWFNEGLAQYASGSDQLTLELTYRMNTGQMLSLPALNEVDALQSPNRELATLQGLAVIQFLVDEFGEDALWALVDSLRYARTFNQALMKTYRHTDLELNEKWMAYAETNYSLLSPAMLRTLLTAAFGVLALLAALVWFVRRSRRLYGAEGPSLAEEEIAAAEAAEQRPDAHPLD